MSGHSHTTLRFLGSGGAFSRSYGTTCSMLTLGDGQRWLIDCGRQAPDQLHAAGIGWHEVDGQIITHVHGDHIYGLEDFAFSRYFMAGDAVAPIAKGGPRPKLVCHSAVQAELWEALAPSLRYIPDPGAPNSGTLETYFEPMPAHTAAPAKTNPWPYSESFTVDGLSLVATETVHVPGKPSTSLAFDVGEGKTAWWSGDSVVDAALLTALEPTTTIFFHDCTFIEYPGQIHGSFSELEKLPPQVRRKLVLMHHEDDVASRTARAEALDFRIGLPGQVYDLWTGQRV